MDFIKSTKKYGIKVFEVTNKYINLAKVLKEEEKKIRRFIFLFTIEKISIKSIKISHQIQEEQIHTELSHLKIQHME